MMNGVGVYISDLLQQMERVQDVLVPDVAVRVVEHESVSPALQE